MQIFKYRNRNYTLSQKTHKNQKIIIRFFRFICNYEMEKFATLQEIIEIYCISRKLVRDILRHYRVDCYKQENEIYINLKEFHKVYTTKYNPVLFTISEEKKKEERKFIIENKINRTFLNIFSSPVDYKKKLKNIAMAYAG